MNKKQKQTLKIHFLYSLLKFTVLKNDITKYNIAITKSKLNTLKKVNEYKLY